MNSTRHPFSAETLPPELAVGRFPEIRTSLMFLVADFLADFERASEAVGLTSAQARVLSFAAIEPSSMRDLAERFGSDPSNITAKADRLFELGLVERQSDPRDGRVKLIAATQRGVAIATQLCSSREWIAKTLSRLDAEDVETVQAALNLLLDQDE